MIHLSLQRNLDTGQETLGTMYFGDKVYQVIERPWKDNENGISCIPPGTYKFIPHGWEEHPTAHKIKCWELVDVPDRTGILIHAANLASSLLGCLSPGKMRGTLDGHPAVLESQLAMDELRAIIGPNEGSITIFGTHV